MFERRRRYRPTFLRRIAAGAFHVAAGFGFLFKNPSFWPWAMLPAVLVFLALVLGATAAFYALQWIEGPIIPGPDTISSGLGFLLYIALALGILLGGILVALALALLLCSPVLEHISRRVESRVRVIPPEADRGWVWDLWEGAKGTVFFLIATPGVLLLSLLPVVGTFFAVIWGAYALAFQQTEAPLCRRGLSFNERRQWHRRWRAETIGFGLASLLLLFIPLANLFLLPALAIGGTLLVLELEDGLTVPDAPADAVAISPKPSA